MLIIFGHGFTRIGDCYASARALLACYPLGFAASLVEERDARILSKILLENLLEEIYFWRSLRFLSRFLRISNRRL